MTSLPLTVNTVLCEQWVAVSTLSIPLGSDKGQGVRSFLVTVESLNGDSKILQKGFVKVMDYLWEDTDSPFRKSAPIAHYFESTVILRCFLNWALNNPQKPTTFPDLFLDYPQLQDLLPINVTDEQAEVQITAFLDKATRLSQRADFSVIDLVVATGIQYSCVQRTLDWLLEINKIKLLEKNKECRWRWIGQVTESKSFPNNGVTISGMNSSQNIDRNKQAVFIIHGRNVQALDALFQFLNSLGLDPHDFDDIRRKMSGTPTIWEVVEAALNQAQAIIVLATPDEYVALHPDFRSANEVDRWQPRPNVLIEAGAAMILGRERTLLVRFGNVDIATDFSGLRFEKIGNDGYSRKLFRDLLVTAGCTVSDNNHYQLPERSGDFERTLPKLPKTHTSFAKNDND
jgi:predicted nucleotide-binding protein